MKTMIALLLASLGGLIVPASAAQPAAAPAGPAAEVAVMRVLVVQAPDARAYAHALSVEQAALRSMGVICTFRVWQAQFAGAEAGTIVVQLEFPSFAMLSRYLATVGTIPATPGEPSIATLRKVVSDSVYREVSAK
jgi:hypothetical protein